MEELKLSPFQFTNPVLFELNFSINKEYQPGSKGEELDFPLAMNVARPPIDECKNNTATVFLTVKVGDEDAAFPCQISATMGADFRWDPSMPEETAEKLLAQNAPALLLGYIRPYVAQITEASPVGAIHLPFANFSAAKKREESFATGNMDCD